MIQDQRDKARNMAAQAAEFLSRGGNATICPPGEANAGAAKFRGKRRPPTAETSPD